MLEAFLPPEVVSGIIYGGPGEGSLLSAASAWSGLALEIEASAAEYKGVLGEVEMAWLGPSSATASASMTSYITSLHQLAAYAQQMGTQAMTAAATFGVVYASVVPPPLIAANRAQLTALVATNFLGVNTAAIAATEAAYMAMWAQDTAAMTAYGASMQTVLATLPVPPTNSSAPSSAQADPTPVGLNDPPPSWLTSGFLGAVLGQEGNGAIAPTNWGAFLSNFLNSTAGLGPNADIWNTLFSSGFFMPAQYAMGDLVAMATAGSASGAGLGPDKNVVIPYTPPAPNSIYSGGGGYSPSASMGRAPQVGGMTVPRTWATALKPSPPALVAPLGTTSSAAIEALAVGEPMAMPGMGAMMPMPMMASSSSQTHTMEEKRGRWSQYDDIKYGDETGSVIPKNPAGG